VAKESHHVYLNNLVNPSKIIKLTSSIILERSEQGMARAEKRDREVKDDSLDLDDSKEAKRHVKQMEIQPLTARVAMEICEAVGRRSLKKPEILLASGIISATKILPLLDGAVLSIILKLS
jgi:hypothetical protein